MITVLKRDGALEPFTPEKLRAALMRVLPEGVDSFGRASVLTGAIECYLLSHGPRFVSSGALLEIALAALRAIHLDRSARQWEQHHSRRWQLRRQLVIHHNSADDSDWSKNWLVSHLCTQWSLGRPTARVLAGQVEQQLMDWDARDVSRKGVLRLLGRTIAANGLTSPAAAKKAQVAERQYNWAPKAEKTG